MFSILFGILASVLPNLLFLWLYMQSKVKAPKQFVKILYVNETLKFAGVAILLSICLQWAGLNVKQFILAFVGAELTRVLCGMLWLARKTTSER